MGVNRISMEGVVIDLESVSMQCFVWLATITALVGLGQMAMGMFFGYWSPTTWMITLSVISASCVLASESDDLDEGPMAVEPTR